MGKNISIPLFPLNTVLFPGQVLPLHIFEERYRRMIGQCIEKSWPFGVTLIQEGEEVGGLAKPFKVGTTARVTQVERLDDGRLNIISVGEMRFRIASLDQPVQPRIIKAILHQEQLGHLAVDQPLQARQC